MTHQNTNEGNLEVVRAATKKVKLTNGEFRVFRHQERDGTCVYLRTTLISEDSERDEYIESFLWCPDNEHPAWTNDGIRNLVTEHCASVGSWYVTGEKP